MATISPSWIYDRPPHRIQTEVFEGTDLVKVKDSVNLFVSQLEPKKIVAIEFLPPYIETSTGRHWYTAIVVYQVLNQ
jgi:hypothetical protein